MTGKELLTIWQYAAKIREGVLIGVGSAGCGHPGGSLSIADLLSVLYFKEMRIDPSRPDWPDRDRFVLSKGHAAPAYYAALALRGYFHAGELTQLRQIDSFLQGHPDMLKVPGVDMSTGSLGQGLSVANGMAMAGKAAGRGYRVYAILGDGESQEGQIWEAVMTAAHYKLDNLTAFLDQNGLQIDGAVTEIMNNTPYEPKFAAFGWHVLSIDGNDPEQIESAIRTAKETRGQPTMVVLPYRQGQGRFFHGEPVRLARHHPQRRRIGTGAGGGTRVLLGLEGK